MKVYCRNKGMRYFTAGPGYPPDGIVFQNHETELEDEFARRLVLEHPEQFSLKKYSKTERNDIDYQPDATETEPVEPVVTEDFPEAAQDSLVAEGE